MAILLATHVGAQPMGDSAKVKLSGHSDDLTIVNDSPQIPFVRGTDLCQYHDAYDRTMSEQMAEFTQTVRGLLQEGVDSRNMMALLNTMHGQLNQQRTLAGSSPRIDVMLSAMLKAYLDRMYPERNPSQVIPVAEFPGKEFSYYCVR